MNENVKGGPRVGDVVGVNRDEHAINLTLRAEVIHTPAGEGDLWGFRDIASGSVFWTNERITVYLKERPGAQAAQGDER